jgi:hypothetical protein
MVVEKPIMVLLVDQVEVVLQHQELVVLALQTKVLQVLLPDLEDLAEVAVLAPLAVRQFQLMKVVLVDQVLQLQ